MKIGDFDFDLPASAIAQHPATPRDAARLLDVGEDCRDRVFRDLPGLLRPGDMLVCNDTAVMPTRLFGRRDDVAVEATLIEDLGGGRWLALARPGRRLRIGQRIAFADDFAAEVAAKADDGRVTLAFDRDGPDLLAAFETYGGMPLPPYIRRPRGGDPRDRIDYQTVFAAHPGAVAAPTAGLHFTPSLLAEADRRGLGRTMVTLHVGAGTFLPVKADDIGDHVMHAERGEISAAAAEAVNAARAAGGRIVAVGTTSLRLIEAAADDDGQLRAFSGETDLFIKPGHRWKIADLLLTNFHLPRSTLFVLVCAFAGTGRMQAAYRHAIAAGYRFYSYGDCCLLRRSEAS
ncbi:MAG: tRNA preQ1(34) S-adenosylmethionine ribosyltransferase-isomerase QueA [Rhodospirillales bacterium]|nr:tRNA preQ1(34) S-adenosylmethionine ribosyltransferase-isomerase QueA [Rhodospirillales bacterium]